MQSLKPRTHVAACQTDPVQFKVEKTKKVNGTPLKRGLIDQSSAQTKKEFSDEEYDSDDEDAAKKLLVKVIEKNRLL